MKKRMGQTYRIRPRKSQKKYTLGEKIRYLRTNRRWNQETLAKASRVPASCVSLYENGKRLPSLYVIQDICDAFRINLSDFFEDVEV